MFTEYCVLFRPYDITRYKGPFCNSNMCGLYVVTVFAVALCNLPSRVTAKTLRRHLIYYLTAGGSLAFILLTISRTAALSAAVLILIRLAIAFLENREKGRTLRAAAGLLPSGVAMAVCFAVCFLGVYGCVRIIPGLLDRQNYLYVELTDSMLTPYKVLPGAALSDPNYISLPRFFEAWTNRTVGGGETLNEISTGRLDIYLAFLKNLTVSGHTEMRIPVEGNFSNMYAHNAFLQIAYNCGIPTGVLYLLCCGFGFLRGMSRKGRAASAGVGAVLTAAYLSCGMFESIEMFYYPLLFTALLGIALSVLSPGEEEPGVQPADGPADAPVDGQDLPAGSDGQGKEEQTPPEEETAPPAPLPPSAEGAPVPETPDGTEEKKQETEPEHTSAQDDTTEPESKTVTETASATEEPGEPEPPEGTGEGEPAPGPASAGKDAAAPKRRQTGPAALTAVKALLIVLLLAAFLLFLNAALSVVSGENHTVTQQLLQQ